MSDEENVNLAPELTKEKLAESAELQKHLRGKFTSPFQTMSPLEVTNYRAAILIQDNSIVINELQKELAKNPSEELLAILNKFYSETAQCWATLGRFDYASLIEPDEIRQAEYEAFTEAVEIDDDKWCEHPKYKIVGGHRTQNYFRELDVASDKHGHVVSILRCCECDFRNARALPQDLAELSRLRQEAINLTRGLSSEAATNLLNSKGMNAEKFKR